VLLLSVVGWALPISKVRDDWNIDKFVTLPFCFKDIGIRGFANLALELSEVVATQMRLLLLTTLCLYPFFEALIVYILNTSAAFAGGHEWVLL
jgi:hypothetical protein